MSLGGEHFSYDLADAVAAAQAQNAVVVAAAGNENTSRLGYPASYEGVISVGATDLSGGRAPYSNFGSRIDVVAPGGNLAEDRDGDGYKDGIVSTWWDEDQNEPNYSLMVGTSMAAPHVAGVVSLMLAVNPNLTPSQVRQIVQQTAVDLGDPGRDDAVGFGSVNPIATLQAAGTQTSTSPRLAVSTTKMDFGKSLRQTTATVSNGGGGTLQVDPPRIETDEGSGWLSVILSRATLTVIVDRTSLATGSYTGRVLLTSNGGSTTVEVLMEVGEEPRTDVGKIFVVAIDPVTFNTIDSTSTEAEIDYKFLIPPVGSGGYLLIASSDSDDDGFICR